MARPLSSFSNHHHHHHHLLPFSSAYSFFVLIAVFSIFSLVTFLCASHRTRKSNQAQKKFVSKINSNISNKALSMMRLISWRKDKVEAEEVEEEEGYDLNDDEVWRKTIIKGERCRPLDFSGKIDYDSEGNLLSDSPNSKENSKTVH